jgi:hypothetical protein
MHCAAFIRVAAPPTSCETFLRFGQSPIATEVHVTKKIELDRLARGADAAAFVEAVREGNAAAVGRDGFTASGDHKPDAPTRALGADRFTASGDGKAFAGTRPSLGGADFTASGVKQDKKVLQTSH